MKKDQIGAVHFAVNRRRSTLCSVTVYSDGTVQRTGNGIKPAEVFAVKATFTKPKVFQDIRKVIPDHLPSTQLFGGLAEMNDRTTEYILSFYGGAKSKADNDKARWEIKTGLRIVHDPTSLTKHPLLDTVRNIGEKILEYTDALYFDSILAMVFEIKSLDYPVEHTLNGPVRFSEKNTALQDYIHEMISIQKWEKILDSVKDKIYYDSKGTAYKVFQSSTQIDSIELQPVELSGYDLEDQKELEILRNISLPAYSYGLQFADSDDLPVFYAISLFAALATVALVSFMVIMAI